jgi:putative aldouronate transport system permease protein
MINLVKTSKKENSITTMRGYFRLSKFKDNMHFFILCSPALVLFFVFHYLPIGGIAIAFKDYQYSLGILGSPWVGFKNFEFFFESQDAFRVVRNTLAYSTVFIALKVIVGISMALLLFEVKNVLALKYYQTTIIFPNFLSWVVVSYITYIVLSPTMGVLNQLLAVFGITEGVDWYSELKAWPFILTITNTWKHMGMDSIIFFAALMGLNSEVFEAASIDGANKWQQITKISIPLLKPISSIIIILAMGSVFRGDFGLFYQIPRDVGTLYPVTDVIDTYIFRGIRQGTMSMTTAVGLIQSVVGLILVLATNALVRRIDEENSLF